MFGNSPVNSNLRGRFIIYNILITYFPLQSTRIDVIERRTESQERLASQLEDKIRRLEEEDMAQNSKIMDIGTELQTYVNNSQQDFRNMSKYHFTSLLKYQWQ